MKTVHRLVLSALIAGLLLGCATTRKPVTTLTQEQMEVILSIATEEINTRIANHEQAIEWYSDPIGAIIDEEAGIIMSEVMIKRQIVASKNEIERLKQLLSKLSP